MAGLVAPYIGIESSFTNLLGTLRYVSLETGFLQIGLLQDIVVYRLKVKCFHKSALRYPGIKKHQRWLVSYIEFSYPLFDSRVPAIG